jgi:hypothetical protein
MGVGSVKREKGTPEWVVGGINGEEDVKIDECKKREHCACSRPQK